MSRGAPASVLRRRIHRDVGRSVDPATRTTTTPTGRPMSRVCRRPCPDDRRGAGDGITPGRFVAIAERAQTFQPHAPGTNQRAAGAYTRPRSRSWSLTARRGARALRVHRVPINHHGNRTMERRPSQHRGGRWWCGLRIATEEQTRVAAVTAERVGPHGGSAEPARPKDRIRPEPERTHSPFDQGPDPVLILPAQRCQ
jgi:hypothetical protein